MRWNKWNEKINEIKFCPHIIFPKQQPTNPTYSSKLFKRQRNWEEVGRGRGKYPLLDEWLFCFYNLVLCIK